MAQEFDLIIIGAGPGGYVAAIKAVQMGKSVVLIEARDLGGTCLNRGCIPTKTLVHSIDLLRNFQDAKKYGIRVSNVAVDYEALHQRQNEVVEQLRMGIASLLAANKVELVQGRGKIISGNKVQVNSTIFQAKNILIATGSEPVLPPIPGSSLPRVYTSDDLLVSSNKEINRLVILGGGVIGVEFAGIYAALGAEVTLIEAQTRLLPLLDREIGQSVSFNLKKHGVNVLTSALLKEFRDEDDQLHCVVEEKGKLTELVADIALVAVGRRANTKDLCADDVFLVMEKNQIVTNDKFETSIENIYAIGDVRYGSIQLAHAASAEAINAVCNMFNEEASYDLSVIPSCIYTSPEIATVGLSEAQAKEKGINVKQGKYLMSGNARSIISQADRGFIKLIFNADNNVIIGAQLICERATDLVIGLVEAIASGLTLQQMKKTVFPHPTFGEGIMEALEDVEGISIHALPRR